jgi:hypothetical protein
MRTAASTACHTISSVVPWVSITMGRIPHAMASWRAVRGEGVRARIGQVGRKREIIRAVRPDDVQAMMAASSASTDARHAAAVIADVIRVVTGASCRPTICSWPSRVPQPR